MTVAKLSKKKHRCILRRQYSPLIYSEHDLYVSFLLGNHPVEKAEDMNSSQIP